MEKKTSAVLSLCVAVLAGSARFARAVEVSGSVEAISPITRSAPMPAQTFGSLQDFVRRNIAGQPSLESLRPMLALSAANAEDRQLLGPLNGKLSPEFRGL